MGGKTKQQRTKNNTKPSSSGRSAELLASSTIPTVGFANVTQFGFLPTMLENFSIADSPSNGIDDMDASLDTNYQLAFRKMTKKDPITKVKALQEFTELVLKTDAATIKTILPFWPRLYNNLSTDVEHRVREAAQQAQAALMTQAGKNIAPYLKQIAPAWITSQYDTYAPAASIATQSFQKSFPAHKLQDVFNFCQNEILDYITKNLTVFTATTLSNPQSNTPEECEAKYQRVLICSLKGYALYLSKISAEHMQEASNKNTALIENGKFWSYQKHKNPGIRAAWFETISALLQSHVDLTKFEKQIAVAALQNIDETETIVLPHLWTAVLLVMQQITEWPSYVNLEKALLPKLWKILKSGGAGSASTIYPHFLPLLSKLNRDIFGEKVLTFYGNFFEHMNTGLRARLVYQANSRSDITAISNAYYECLQYVVIQIQSMPRGTQGDSDAAGGEDNSNFNAEEYALNLMQTHIIDVIRYLLLNANLCNGKYVLIRMVELIQFWNQTRATNTIYNAFLTRFWNELYTTIEQSFGNTEAELHLRPKLELIHDLVQCLRSRPINVTKVKSAKVKFNIDADRTVGHDNDDDDGDGDDDDANDRIGGHAKVDTGKANIFFKDEINELIIKLCKFYIKKTSDSVTDHFVQPLEKLLNEFGNSTKFFEQLSGSATDIAKLYDKFTSWLLLKEIRSESVLHIVLMLYHHLDPIEKSKLLNKLVKFPNECVKNWTLSRLLSHPLCTEPEVGRLLSQPIVTAQILKNAEEMAAGKTSETVNLMHKCFFQTESGDILIDNKTCERIIEILCNALTANTGADADDAVLDTCASFLAQIMPVICGDQQKGAIRDRMFVCLFGLCIDKERLAMLSEDTLWETITSWQDALSSNDIELTPALLETCAELIENRMNAIIADPSVTVNNIESVAEITSKLIVCSIERFEDDNETKYRNADLILASIFTKLQKQYTEYFDGCLQACTFIELLNGGITAVPTILKHLENDLGTIDVYRNANALLKLATFKFRVVFNLTCTVPKSRKSSESESEVENEHGEIDASSQQEHTDDKQPTALEEEHTEDFCDMNESLLKKWSDKIYDEIHGAIYLGGLFNSFLDNFNLLPAFEEFILHFQESIRLFLTHIADDKVDVIVKHWINADRLDDPFAVNSTLLLQEIGPYGNQENALALLHNDLTKACNGTENLQQYTNVLLAYTPKLALRQLSISANIFGPSTDTHYRAIGLRCLMKNYFSSDCNEFGDQQIVNECMHLIDELYVQSKTNKELLLYNDNISPIDAEQILRVTEFVRFVSDVIQTFPGNITESGWDFIRIAISSWVLTLSKSSEHLKTPKIAVFTSAIYKMFEVFSEFIAAEQIKSSTRTMSQIVDEWEHVFAKDVNLILLKCFMRFVQANAGASDNRQEYYLKMFSHAINRVDFKHVQVAHRIDSQTSIDDLIQFALTNLSHDYHAVRVECMTIITRMSKYLIQSDVEQLSKRQEKQTIDESVDSTEWHLLHKFRTILLAQNEWTSKFIEEFNFKSTELDDFSEIPADKSMPFMLLWHCILEICNGAPSELRSIYASYLIEERFEQTFLQMLFRMMPADVLRSQELKAAGSAYFLPIEWHEIANDEISIDRYACHLYTLALKYLPALVRRWWTNSHPRQKSLVDKITTAFVSTQLCNDELRALLDKKEKHDSFQINVHQSTREVHATYVIDEARMELIIQMPLNYPLGVVKVNCGQQIGDKLQSRVVVMQLSIFLTHQNGSIWDGLSLWKRNLDRKFDGVEECYVCYSVIHQETCQLPKLTCKTCKKKFHGQCLYKWFSTSNKSTCPICRNMF